MQSQEVAEYLGESLVHLVDLHNLEGKPPGNSPELAENTTEEVSPPTDPKHNLPANQDLLVAFSTAPDPTM